MAANNSTHEVVSPESIEAELEDYSAPILIQDLEFHLDLFTRKFLAKLASIHQDTLLFQFGSRTAALGKRVGERKAWDIAGEVQRTLGRQTFPASPFLDKIDGFSLDLDDLTKPGLLKLIQTYWDQWIKVTCTGLIGQMNCAARKRWRSYPKNTTGPFVITRCRNWLSWPGFLWIML